MINVQEVFSSYGIKQTGPGKYQCKCPSHDDKTASLSIQETDDKILLNCFAGCDVENIITNVGYSVYDLFVKDEDFKAHYKLEKKAQFNEKQFITDYQIVILVNGDFTVKRNVSTHDINKAKESMKRINKISDPDKLYVDLINENEFNLAYSQFTKLSEDAKNGGSYDLLAEHTRNIIKIPGLFTYEQAKARRIKLLRGELHATL